MSIKTDYLSIPIFDSQEVIELLYKGRTDQIEKIVIENTDETLQFKENLEEKNGITVSLYQNHDIDLHTFDHACQSIWLMPEHYAELDIEAFLINKCEGDYKKIDRVKMELSEYRSKNMYNVLKFMVFLVDFMTEKNVIWGVGRGSSVASYVLYLIGIHKVDSIFYDLDFYEFMK